MKINLLFLMALLVLSCNTNKEKNIPDSNPTQKTNIHPKDEEPQLEKETPLVIKENTIITKDTVAHYICYTDDALASRRIWISFTKEGQAIQVKYKGQKEAIDLVYIKEDMTDEGAYPTVISVYDEMYNGKKNGTYTLTHAGVWDYVLYTRQKDGKQFNFTIDHEADPYGSKPCF